MHHGYELADTLRNEHVALFVIHTRIRSLSLVKFELIVSSIQTSLFR